MGRKWFLACLGGCALAALGVFILLSPRPSTAEPNKLAPKDVPAIQVTQLPIGQVVLFTSGVGYFQREGAVEGDARVDLSFPVTDINDLIKCMVLRDLDGGHISAVSYDSNAPVERPCRASPSTCPTNPTFAQVLNQARGEKVEVVLQQANAAQPGTLTGTRHGRREAEASRRRQGHGRSRAAEPVVRRRHAQREAARRAARALPQSRSWTTSSRKRWRR